MTDQMRGVTFEGIDHVVCRSWNVPEPGPEQVLLRIAAATVCATDFHIAKGEYAARPGTILGHEIAGRVVALGSHVTTVGVGELVSVEPHHYCGLCKPCRTGKEYLCTHKQAYGVTEAGGLAEYMVADYRNCYRVASSVSPAVAALTENVACGIHGIDRAQIALGDDVVILGAGAVGQILLQLAFRAGAHRVIVADPVAERRDQALQLGATGAVDPGDVRDLVMDLTQSEGADVVIEASGTRSAQQLTFDLAGRGGTIEFFGVAPNHDTISLNGFDVYQKEWRIVGAALNWAAHGRAVSLLESLSLAHLIDEPLSLDEVAQRLTTHQKGPSHKMGYVAHE